MRMVLYAGAETLTRRSRGRISCLSFNPLNRVQIFFCPFGIAQKDQKASRDAAFPQKLRNQATARLRPRRLRMMKFLWEQCLR
jgi:hypothetical protein